MRHLLLLDLDGVVVVRDPHQLRRGSTFLLHPDLIAAASDLDCGVVILTHRPRSEAEQIVRALPGGGSRVLGIMGAGNILKAALGSGKLHRLLTRGLLKSFAIGHLERKYGIHPRSMAMLDDSEPNIRTTSDEGIGLAMLAPTPRFGCGLINTFSSSSAIGALHSWIEQGDSVPRMQALSYDEELSTSQLAAVSIRTAGVEEAGRRLARALRTAVIRHGAG